MLNLQREVYFESPPAMATAIFDKEDWLNPLWEPTAGNRVIVDAARSHGHTCFPSDLYPLGGEECIDFLRCDENMKGVYDIIAAPPYEIFTEFSHQAFRMCKEKFAFGVLSSMLGGIGRHNEVFSKYPVKKILFSPRVWKIPSSQRGWAIEVGN